jgi:hypothetical protein
MTCAFLLVIVSKLSKAAEVVNTAFELMTNGGFALDGKRGMQFRLRLLIITDSEKRNIYEKT